MVERTEPKRFSFWGILSILLIGVVIYLFMQGGHLMLLYAVATIALCVILIVVAFDLGVRKRSKEEEHP
ncbi:MAG: hypothetical protein N0A16_08305 [Blastocatellia bacterium]|nr:hypothetical protein [Blastocatellia bacterium]MCS7157718.1 hypothetical protein [Blastocatellia bacterium]MCX7751983.1 hypothetical protein [Blastocatellia bacterium]MDW8167089.1 hypothetical protein [Acidobacteriota bacterium]MDW8257193.1 hypothetical protein [Acidobacteriota bacterium]